MGEDRMEIKYYKRQSDNGYLWYAVDEFDKICFVSAFNEDEVDDWIEARL